MLVVDVVMELSSINLFASEILYYMVKQAMKKLKLYEGYALKVIVIRRY